MVTTNVIRKNEFVPASAEAANEKSKLTLAVAKVSGTIWCSYHQGQANAETGAFLMRNRTKRWMCAGCMKLRGIEK